MPVLLTVTLDEKLIRKACEAYVERTVGSDCRVDRTVDGSDKDFDARFVADSVVAKNIAVIVTVSKKRIRKARVVKTQARNINPNPGAPIYETGEQHGGG